MSAEPIIGFRLWSLGGENLRGWAIRDFVWSPGANRDEEPPREAGCLGMGPGFHAWYGAECNNDWAARELAVGGIERRRWSMPPIVWGAIVAWGTVRWHELGFRAQCARPVALLRSQKDPDLVTAPARKYGIPAVSTEADLLTVALEHGVPAEAPVAA